MHIHVCILVMYSVSIGLLGVKIALLGNIIYYGSILFGVESSPKSK